MNHDAADGIRSPRLTRNQVWFFSTVLLTYATLSYYGDLESAPRGLAVALAVGPIVLIGFVLTWRWTRRWLAVLGLLLACVVLHRYWGFLMRHRQAAEVIEQGGAYALIALAFAHSLRSTQGPLCARVVRQLHGALTPTEIAYLRSATLAWAAFYLSIAATIAVLHVTASQRIWSLFVNFGTFALIAVATIADYLLRRWLLPRRPGNGLLDTLRRALIG